MRPDPSALTRNELSNLLWILDALDDVSARQHLRDQVDSISVVNRDAMHTSLVVTRACSTALVPDGPVDVRAVAYDSEGDPIGFVTAWVEAGRLSRVSMGWVTDEMPDDFPPAASLQLADRND